MRRRRRQPRGSSAGSGSESDGPAEHIHGDTHANSRLTAFLRRHLDEHGTGTAPAGGVEKLLNFCLRVPEPTREEHVKYCATHLTDVLPRANQFLERLLDDLDSEPALRRELGLQYPPRSRVAGAADQPATAAAAAPAGGGGASQVVTLLKRLAEAAAAGQPVAKRAREDPAHSQGAARGGGQDSAVAALLALGVRLGQMSQGQRSQLPPAQQQQQQQQQVPLLPAVPVPPPGGTGLGQPPQGLALPQLPAAMPPAAAAAVVPTQPAPGGASPQALLQQMQQLMQQIQQQQQQLQPPAAAAPAAPVMQQQQQPAPGAAPMPMMPLGWPPMPSAMPAFGMQSMQLPMLPMLPPQMPALPSQQQQQQQQQPRSGGGAAQGGAAGGGRARRGRGKQRCAAAEEEKPPGCCLLVVMRNGPDSLEVAPDELYWLFSQFGVVERVSVFRKLDVKPPQALLQMADPACTALAKDYLNGRLANIRDKNTAQHHKVTVAIVPSSHRSLRFVVQDESNREYLERNTALQTVLEDAGRFADALRPHIGDHVIDFFWGKHRCGEGWLWPRQDAALQGCIPEADTAVRPQGGKVGDCILITGLATDEQVAAACPQLSCDGLMSASNLMGACGCYGEVIAVKLLQKYTDRALVQFSCKAEAQVAEQKLSGAQLFGRTWEVCASKHANAHNWCGAQTGLEGRMCVVGTGPGARPSPELPSFAPGPPQRGLVLWGFPAGGTAADVTALFAGEGLEVQRVGALDKTQPGTWVVSLRSTDEAFAAVALLNGREGDCGAAGTATVHVAFAPAAAASSAPAAF